MASVETAVSMASPEETDYQGPRDSQEIQAIAFLDNVERRARRVPAAVLETLVAMETPEALDSPDRKVTAASMATTERTAIPASMASPETADSRVLTGRKVSRETTSAASRVTEETVGLTDFLAAWGILDSSDPLARLVQQVTREVLDCPV